MFLIFVLLDLEQTSALEIQADRVVSAEGLASKGYISELTLTVNQL